MELKHAKAAYTLDAVRKQLESSKKGLEAAFRLLSSESSAESRTNPNKPTFVCFSERCCGTVGQRGQSRDYRDVWPGVANRVPFVKHLPGIAERPDCLS